MPDNHRTTDQANDVSEVQQEPAQVFPPSPVLSNIDNSIDAYEIPKPRDEGSATVETPTKLPRAYTVVKSDTIVQGKLFKRPSLFNPADATKAEMLYLLLLAGEDISEVTLMPCHPLAEHMVKVRSARARSGKTGTFFTEEEVEAHLAATSNNEPLRHHKIRRAWQKKLKLDKLDAGGDVDEDESDREELEQDRREEEQRAATPPLRTYTMPQSRSYLLALKRQAKLDARYNPFSDYEYIPVSDIAAAETYIAPARDTYLRDHHGDILFSMRVQRLVREILRYREVVRDAEFDLAGMGMGGEMSAEVRRAVYMRDRVERELVGCVMERVEGGVEEAEGMVGEFFGVGGGR
ncbi:hypothetical protein CC86DRAFT_403640 [Ophiobolus disseminans]|uniref:Uncharacterized protein n=1 Tax=Ophiobolus disseminans TaxID=1469910 RepID=A0A6A7A8D4_9PLEO|nr:hypothetical protein CC86DRAFT_403640 [Ophiobolus disseminans]